MHVPHCFPADTTTSVKKTNRAGTDADSTPSMPYASTDTPRKIQHADKNNKS